MLDIGCHLGRNSLYLAQLGHQVVGVTDNPQDARDATELAQAADLQQSCAFVAGDARALPVRGQFDAVLINEVLHMTTKRQAHRVLDRAKALTRPGGLHLVSGYVVAPNQATRQNAEHCLWPEELADLYHDDNWRVISYAEDPFSFQMLGQRQVVNSLARVVARRRR